MAISTPYLNRYQGLYLQECRYWEGPYTLYAPPQEQQPHRYDPRDIEFSVRRSFECHDFVVDWHLDDLAGHIRITEETLYNSRLPENCIRERVLDEVTHLLRDRPSRNRHLDPNLLRHNYEVPTFSWQSDPISSEARQKAENLLLRTLTPKQLETYRKYKFFYVNVPKYFGDCHGNYKILSKYTFNILNEEKGICYCAGPKNSEQLPLADVLLAQKLMLETIPKEFLSKANKRSTHPYTISTFAAI